MSELYKKKFAGILNFLILYSSFLYVVMSSIYVFNPRNFDDSWWWIMLLLTFLMISPLWLCIISAILTLRATLFVKKDSIVQGIIVICLYVIGFLSSGFVAILTVIGRILQLLGQKHRDVIKLANKFLPLVLLCAVCLIVAYIFELFCRRRNKSLFAGFGGLLKRPITYIICVSILLSILFVPYEKNKVGIDGDNERVYHIYNAFICSYVDIYDQNTDQKIYSDFWFFPKNYCKLTDNLK